MGNVRFLPGEESQSVIPGTVLCRWIGLGVVLTRAFTRGGKDQSQDDDIRFLPANTPSVRAYELLEKAFPNDLSASKAIFAVERRAKAPCPKPTSSSSID